MGSDRRDSVLESALATFALFGYRRCSMDEIARRASISRPGLYLYFPTKRDLLRAAVEHALERDLSAAERALREPGRGLQDRVLDGLLAWTVRYVGPLAADLDAVVEQDPALLADLRSTYSARFAALLTGVLAEQPVDDAEGVARPLCEVVVALAAGLKHRARDGDEFRELLAYGVGRILR